MPDQRQPSEPAEERVERLQSALHQAQHLALAAAIQHQELSLILDSITDGCFVVDRQWQITNLNAEAESFLGRSRADLIQQSLWKCRPDLEDSTLGTSLAGAMVVGLPATSEWYDDGTASWWEVRAFPVTQGLMVYLRNISERNRLIERLAHQAFHDPLTGLPNRSLLYDRLRQAFARAGRHEHGVGLCFLDLDNFKQINDTLGHEAGDSVLVQIAQRLEQVLRPEDTVARLGGDEFVIVLPEVLRAADALAVAERLRRSVSEPVEIAGQLVVISASVGVAVDRYIDFGPQGLIRAADAAMYTAKSQGKNRVVRAPAGDPPRPPPQDRPGTDTLVRVGYRR